MNRGRSTRLLAAPVQLLAQPSVSKGLSRLRRAAASSSIRRVAAEHAARRDALSIGDIVFLSNTPVVAEAASADVPAHGSESLLTADGYNTFELTHVTPDDRELDNCLFRLCEPIAYRRNALQRLAGADAPPRSSRP